MFAFPAMQSPGGNLVAPPSAPRQHPVFIPGGTIASGAPEETVAGSHSRPTGRGRGRLEVPAQGERGVAGLLRGEILVAVLFRSLRRPPAAVVPLPGCRRIAD